MLTRIKMVIQTIFFLVLSIVIVIGASILGLMLSFLIPCIPVFTGLWVIWFVWKDHRNSDNISGM